MTIIGSCICTFDWHKTDDEVTEKGDYEVLTVDDQACKLRLLQKKTT